ncbi:MAG: PASTA domain-containing protein [Terriglobales bacterium]
MRHSFQGRAYLRYLLMALVLITVFMVSALMAMRLAIHGREVAVPQLTGMSPTDAARAAQSNGLLFEVENRFYSSSVPEGRIMTQVPAAGAVVRRGWKVRVAQSLGPQRVQIPNLAGQSQRAAEINLAQRGLEPGKLSFIHISGLPAEEVIGQSPAAGAEGVASPTVNMLLTAPPEETTPAFVMPDFVGKLFGEATSALAEGGFKLGSVAVTVRPGSPFANEPAGKLRPIATDTIVRQSPSAGQKIFASQAIEFEVQR